MQRTTLRFCASKRTYIAIAGKAYSGPVKDHDAIWTFVNPPNRPRAKSCEPTIELALVVDPDDYNRAEARRQDCKAEEEAELNEVELVSTASFLLQSQFNHMYSHRTLQVNDIRKKREDVGQKDACQLIQILLSKTPIDIVLQFRRVRWKRYVLIC
jgi:hypothetical protein